MPAPTIQRFFPMPKTESAAAPMDFAHNPLNRQGHERQKSDWLHRQLKAANALFVPFWQDKPFILPPLRDGEGRDTGWLTQAQTAPLRKASSAPIFLGINRSAKPLFALTLEQAAACTDLQKLGAFEDLRALALAGDMPPAELGILAQAKALLHWHQTHKHCARCGAPTALAEGGYKRRCESCSAEHFPRTDPVVIMLATFRDSCLLGRQKGWPEGMFSALAGFVEPGETLEAAVARELEEEAGISVRQVRYRMSQPWPFPAQLMLGCTAEADGDRLRLDGVELEDARWVKRAELVRALAGRHPSLTVPPPLAIAHHLIQHFAAG